MVKAVFFDIDGTLVSFRTHSIPASAQLALDMLRQQGIRVFIASGRHLSAINNLGSNRFDGYVTINGGQTIIDGRVVDMHAMEADDVRGFARWVETESRMPCVFVHPDGMVMNRSNPDVDDLFELLHFPYPPIADLRQAARKPVLQIIAFFDAASEPAVMKHLPHCTATRWYPTFSDVVPQGISKTVGLDCIARHLHIDPSEMMAFGDGGNDIEMLRYAGTGVAMGNADDAVKAAADYVTTSVDDDGIMNALKHFGLIR